MKRTALSRAWRANERLQRVPRWQWHTIRCERTATRVTMTVDGVIVARRNGTTGSISNTWPLSIAGKVSCDQVRVTCDYFPGFIDRIQIDAG